MCCRLPVFSICQTLINTWDRLENDCWLKKKMQVQAIQVIKGGLNKNIQPMLQIWKIPWRIVLLSTPAEESYPASLQPVSSASVNCALNWFLGLCAASQGPWKVNYLTAPVLLETTHVRRLDFMVWIFTCSIYAAHTWLHLLLWWLEEQDAVKSQR